MIDLLIFGVHTIYTVFRWNRPKSMIPPLYYELKDKIEYFGNDYKILVLMNNFMIFLIVLKL